VKLIVFNGSPRGGKSNTRIVLDHFLDGFTGIPGNSHERFRLVDRRRWPEYVERFTQAEYGILAFPLYVHAMPGLVKHFIEALKPVDPSRGVKLGFIVQYGFSEGHHVRWLEPYLTRLATRLGCQNLGLVSKGGAEGIQIRPEWMTRRLFEQFRLLGQYFGRTGTFDSALIHQLAQPEWFSGKQKIVLRAAKLTGLLDWHWNQHLKKHKAWDRRFDRPYQP
jgi:hypothetical protein